MDFTGLVTPASIAANFTEAGSNLIDFFGLTKFPRRKKAGLDLAWLKGHKGVPISLMPSDFDTEPTFRDRIGVEKLETEMPFFREGIKIKEKDRQELLRARDANDPYLLAILERVYDDMGDLIAAADVAAERMIMQLLFPENGNAGISIKANGVDYTYNYDSDGSWKTSNYTALTGNDLWTAPTTADPFAAFEAVKDGVRARTGSEPTIAVMNGSTFNLLAKCTAVKNRYLSSNGLSLGYLTKEEVKRVIADTTGVAIAVYDKQYRDESKVAHKFATDGYVSFMPDGDLGNMWYGTTPEEADLMNNSNAMVEIVNTGVAITRTVQAEPVNVNIFASEIVLPSFERMDEVAVLKVTGE